MTADRRLTLLVSFEDEATAEAFARNEALEPHTGIAQAIGDRGGRLRDTFVEPVIIEVAPDGAVVGTYEVDDETRRVEETGGGTVPSPRSSIVGNQVIRSIASPRQ